MEVRLYLLVLAVMLMGSGRAQVYEFLQELPEPSSTNRQLAISQHSEVIAVGSDDGGLHIYFNNGSKFGTYQEYSVGAYSIISTGITPDGKWVAVAGFTKNPDFQTRVSVFCYEPRTNSYREFFNFYNEITGAFAVAISNDHQWLFSGHGFTLEVEVFKFAGDTYKPHEVLVVPGPIASLDLTDDGMFLAVGLFKSSIVIFKSNGNGYDRFQEIRFSGSDVIRRVSLTGDGKRLLISHTFNFFVDIYEFNEISQQFELLPVNGSLVFPGELTSSA